VPEFTGFWHYRLLSMGLRLSVHRRAWQQSVDEVAASLPGLIPVVKGNGYGFGRGELMPHAARLSTHIAVGSVYEAVDVPTDRTAVVLTPHIGALPPSLPTSATLTVGSIAHVDSLRTHGWTGSVVVKLRSSMRRYGVSHSGFTELTQAVTNAGFTIVGYALHFPLVGSSAEHAAEVDEWMTDLDPAIPVSVSHLDADTYRQLCTRHSTRRVQIRTGTALWHGDKAFLHLSADVLDSQTVEANDTVGYRGVTITQPGHVLLVAAGSAHGVRALDDSRSPFHFDRHRLPLIEPPHMHTSMVFVGADQPCAAIGDRIDVQRPLIHTLVDELEWVDD
jgi:alanine racemase